ncbi:MAG TPA: hypothetical protein VMR21_01940 [Vicinamibacteria bacterium]|nr:hypothetical protein [Vicinamibacteria bacterium]
MAGPVLLALAVAEGTRRNALPELAWPDEYIYLVGARNLLERGTLDTNFYLTYSLLRRGHPHRDVHMPGYVFALTPAVAALGPGLGAAAALNVALFAGAAALVFSIGRALLPERRQAVVAALLFTVLPPFPGYLFVAYPEIVVTFVFLAGVAVLVHARGTAGAAAAGALLAAGALFRETLLLALPLYLARLPPRARWRGFVPGALAGLLLLVGPFARDRAVHPNALYPSVLEEARRSEAPLRALAQALWANVSVNLRSAAQLDPGQRAEDAMLLLVLVLSGAAALGARRLSPDGRRMAAAVLLSLALLTAAVVTLYVVRERGGVWGGVRAYMAWLPLLLVLATPLLFAARRHAATVAVTTLLAAGAVGLDRWQVRFFNRYKGSDLEDQARNERYLARYIDAHHPQRIVSRSFLYGYTHYPVEVVWSLPRDGRELAALNEVIGYEFLSIHERSALRPVLIGNPRYLRVNRDDRGAEFLIWRRLY